MVMTGRGKSRLMRADRRSSYPPGVASILVIDDDPAIGQAVTGLLGHAGHTARHAATGDEALELLRDEPTDLALLDLRLGDQSGLELLPRLKALRPEMSVVMITALGTIDNVVEAMKRGADNFVVKPVDPPRLLAVVQKGLESGDLRRKNLQLDRISHRPPASLFADSEEMRDTLALAEAVAHRTTTVLLLGETGTGKGMLARHIHDLSPRVDRPFVELNCAGLQRELTESELFGYEKGSFTGAAGRKIGLYDAADGGTLFLDEIGEMDLAIQAKLLKVLEQRRFRRIGGIAEIEVDVRVIAATHRDLARDVEAGKFRGDLLYRLNVFAIRLPSLRERQEEILPLAQRFLEEARGEKGRAEISPEAARLLKGYRWPGNVRELRNVMERAAILCARGPVLPKHLPPLADPSGKADEPGSSSDDATPEAGTLKDAEKRFLANALQANGGNIQATARALGVSRGTLYRKIVKYGIASGE
jgi:two-component system, NtrC family, response regulator AtoC